MKFTPPGGNVHVDLTCDPTGAVFCVADSGRGISAEDLPHVFDRFFQGDRKRHGHADERGTGLGLSICRAIVEAHEGTIQVASALGKGTCFTVRLPASKVDLEAASAGHPRDLQTT